MLFIASKYSEKGYGYEELRYGDDLNGREEFADEVHEYMVEYNKIGSIAFYDKYKEYKLY